MRFCVFSRDPLYKYHEKGEIKERYWNPEEIFDEVCVFSFCDRDVEAHKMQALVGAARLEIVPIGYPSPYRLWGQYRGAVSILGEARPDVLRVHNPWDAGVVGIGAARALGIPSVLSLHTHYDARRRWEKSLILQALPLCERYSVSRADAVLCVSHYLQGYAKKMGAKSISVIYNRVYTDQFKPGGVSSAVGRSSCRLGALTRPKTRRA